MSALPEVVNCDCGRKARAWCIWTGEWQVICNRHWHVNSLRKDCWFGPVRKTERGSITAWNRVMEKV